MFVSSPYQIHMLKLNPSSKPLLGHPAELWGWHCHPRGLGRHNIDPKWIILETWHQMKFVPSGFGLTWDLSLLVSFSCFFPLEWECYLVAVPWLCGKHIMYLVSEVHSLRGICLRMNCTLSHIHICFSWCVDEISDFKVDARMSKDFRGYWDGMNVYCMWEGQEFGRPGVECNRLNIGIPQGSYVEAWSPLQ